MFLKQGHIRKFILRFDFWFCLRHKKKSAQTPQRGYEGEPSRTIPEQRGVSPISSSYQRTHLNAAVCEVWSAKCEVHRFLTFTQIINVSHITMSSSLVIGQCGSLSVGLVTDVTRVWLVMGVDHVMLIQTGVFCEAFVAPNHLTDVRPLSCQLTTKKQRCYSKVG